MDVRERSNIRVLHRHFWELSRADVVWDMLKQRRSGRLKVVDIGCGDLFLEEYLQAKGTEALYYCIDVAYSDEELERLNRKSPDIRVYNRMEMLDRQAVKADVILLLDVVEHIEKDAGFLRELYRQSFFTEDTLMLITVPAFQGLYTSHDRFLGHYRRYNYRQLTEVLKSSGLEIEKGGYFYSLLLPFRGLQKLKEKVTGRQGKSTGIVEWKGGPRLTGLLRGVLNTDYRIGKFFNARGCNIPGLSVYALCRKKRV